MSFGTPSKGICYDICRGGVSQGRIEGKTNQEVHNNVGAILGEEIWGKQVTARSTSTRIEGRKTYTEA